VASRSLPQRVARAVGESPISERVARAQELAYGQVIEWVRRTPLHTDVLGHSIHPSLTDVTAGCWLSTSLLDLAGGSESRRGATLLAGAGSVRFTGSAWTLQRSCLPARSSRGCAAATASARGLPSPGT
jgi:hypothetical protein